MSRRGNWIQTFTGRRFFPMDPSPDDVVIEDIAHALAMTCRFRGHTTRFYSVAEHSVLVAQNVGPEDRLAALLHDAAEAYLADIPRPVKPFLRGYGEVEDAVERAIAERFGLAWPWPAAVKAIDTAILHDERRHLMAPTAHEWNVPGLPLGLAAISGYPPKIAEQLFMIEYRAIMGADL